MTSDPEQPIINGAAWFAALGALMIVAGAAAAIVPIFSPLSVAIILAWVFLVGGLTRVVQAFKSLGSQNFGLSLAIGILYLVIAILLFTAIVGAVVPLRFALAFTLILEGILENILALRLRLRATQRWVFISGMLSIILGIAVASGVAGGIGWILGLLVGLSLAVTGVWFILLAFGIRSIVDK